VPSTTRKNQEVNIQEGFSSGSKGDNGKSRGRRSAVIRLEEAIESEEAKANGPYLNKLKELHSTTIGKTLDPAAMKDIGVKFKNLNDEFKLSVKQPAIKVLKADNDDKPKKKYNKQPKVEFAPEEIPAHSYVPSIPIPPAATLFKNQLEDENLQQVDVMEDFADNENDVLFQTEVDDSKEFELMEIKQILARPTAAQLELSNWKKTLVLNPRVSLQLVENIEKETNTEIASGDLDCLTMEYISRAYQEMILTMIPDLLNVSRHKGNSTTTIDVGDLVMYCRANKSMSPQIKTWLLD